MAEELYALQRDFDMLTTDVENLKRGYNAIDRIAKRFDDLWQEQLFQSEQMRRIEEEQKAQKVELYQLRKELLAQRDEIKNIKEQLGKIEAKIDAKIDRMWKILLLICQKLEINPAL